MFNFLDWNFGILTGSRCAPNKQVETIQQYFPVFDKLREEFFVGELIWNFADFMTKQRKVVLL